MSPRGRKLIALLSTLYFNRKSERVLGELISSEHKSSENANNLGESGWTVRCSTKIFSIDTHTFRYACKNQLSRISASIRAKRLSTRTVFNHCHDGDLSSSITGVTLIISLKWINNLLTPCDARAFRILIWADE